MSSSIKLNSSAGSVLMSSAVGSRQEPCANSSEEKVQAIAPAVIAAGKASPLLHRRPSMVAAEFPEPRTYTSVFGGREVSSRKVLGQAGVTRSDRSSSRSPDLEPAPPGAQYFSDELGKVMRLASFGGEKMHFTGPSPILKSFLTGCNSGCSSSTSPSTKLSPSPVSSRSEALVAASPIVFSIKYDKDENYLALGDQKSLEDLPLSKDIIPANAAYAYLQSIMHTPGDFGIDHYLETNRLLLGIEGAPTFRSVERTTYCLVPEKFIKEFLFGEDGEHLMLPVEKILVDEIGNTANSKIITGSDGRVFSLYKIKHKSELLAEKLAEHIHIFNVTIADAYATGVQDLYSVHLNAIVLLFMRLEQLRTVDQCRRTNLAVLNYLLAKHNLPCVIFNNQYYPGTKYLISDIDYMSFTHLTHQVIQGMQNWCRVVGRPYPFTDLV